MTRKDYIVVAEAFRKAYNEYGHTPMMAEAYGVKTAMAHVCEAFKADNPRFDTQHFVEVVTGQRELTSRPSKKTVKL